MLPHVRNTLAYSTMVFIYQLKIYTALAQDVLLTDFFPLIEKGAGVLNDFTVVNYSLSKNYNN